MLYTSSSSLCGQVFGEMVMEGVLSPDWKSREMAVAHTSREVVSLLLLQIKATPVSMVTGAEWREIHEAAFLIILNGCSDSVLKVFLASLVSGSLFILYLTPSLCTFYEQNLHFLCKMEIHREYEGLQI